MMSGITDTKYMGIALKLAEKAKGLTSPNPAVGAVIVKNNRIIGRGYHKKAGLHHAEIEAINDARKKVSSLKGTTLYVTLEPCCHKNKKTPPCINALLKEDFARVVIGTLDKNPHVKGTSVRILKRNKIEVKIGVLEDKCNKLNEAFFKFITRRIPFVTLKTAATMDARISTSTGDSKWIGSEKQREFAHRLRYENDAVIVGINTVIKDNPMLNIRHIQTTKQPVAVVLDSNLRIPPDSNLVTRRAGTIIFVSEKTKKKSKRNELARLGVSIIDIKSYKSGGLNLLQVVKKLGALGITSVLVEGGSQVVTSFLKKGLADKIVFFYSPKIVGGDGTAMVGKLGIKKIKDSILLTDVDIKIFDGEIMFTGYIII